MGNIWGIHHLVPHPQTPPRNVEAVRAHILSADTRSLMIEYSVRPASMVLMPPEVEPARARELWRTTCFEAFLTCAESSVYHEFNFAPSFAWAAYAFDSYRHGMCDLSVVNDPEIWTSEGNHGHFFLSAEFDWPLGPADGVTLGLSAVIEEIDGTKSYWALRHPPGPPDFHHPDCFALELPALGTP